MYEFSFHKIRSRLFEFLFHKIRNRLMDESYFKGLESSNRLFLEIGNDINGMLALHNELVRKVDALHENILEISMRLEDAERVVDKLVELERTLDQNRKK